MMLEGARRQCHALDSSHEVAEDFQVTSSLRLSRGGSEVVRGKRVSSSGREAFVYIC